MHCSIHAHAMVSAQISQSSFDRISAQLGFLQPPPVHHLTLWLYISMYLKTNQNGYSSVTNSRRPSHPFSSRLRSTRIHFVSKECCRAARSFVGRTTIGRRTTTWTSQFFRGYGWPWRWPSHQQADIASSSRSGLRG